MKLNSFSDYNEKNWGLKKLRNKYPKETDDQIAVRVLGRPLKIPKHLGMKVKQ